MKLVLIAVVIAIAAKAAEPDTKAVIEEVRSLVVSPDQWADMSLELQKLDSLAKRCKEGERESVEGFRRSLASYSGYFSEHPFTLSAAERAAFALVVRAYEDRFTSERVRILKVRHERPEQDRGCVDASTLALLPADHELERCAPVLAKHNANKDRPNELAAAVIGVIREYGRLLASLTEEPIQQPEPMRAKGPHGSP